MKDNFEKENSSFVTYMMGLLVGLVIGGVMGVWIALKDCLGFTSVM